MRARRSLDGALAVATWVLVATPAFLGASPAPAPSSAPRRCDVLVRGGIVLTEDAGHQIFSPGAVAIADGRIAAVGPERDVAASFSPAETVDASGEIVMPGLVNTHGHAAMTLLRGLGGDLALQEWLTKVIFPAEAKNVSPGFVRDGVRLACLEMIEGGTTTFTDMYYFESDAAEVVHEVGMRAVLGETFIDFPVPDHKDLEETLRYAEAFIRRWKGDPLVTPAVAPHAPYTCSKETLLAARRLADAENVPILIHVAETRREVEDARRKWGKTPLEYLQSIGFLGHVPTVLAHAVWPGDGGGAIIRRAGASVSDNPESNMKLASGAAPVADYAREGVLWSLGTDGAASNDDLSMFESMDFAGKLARLTASDPTALPARVIVEAATIGGARALGLGGRVGSLEPGKEADLIAVDTGAAHAVPGDDPEAMIVYSLKASDVTDVWVAGRRLLARRVPRTIDPKAASERAREWRVRIGRSLSETAKKPA